MADFKIKSAAGTGNKTLIQGQDQSGSNYAIQVGDAGATTLTNATITAWTPPAGTIIKVTTHSSTAEVDANVNSGIETDANDITVTCTAGNKLHIWVMGGYIFSNGANTYKLGVKIKESGQSDVDVWLGHAVSRGSNEYYQDGIPSIMYPHTAVTTSVTIKRTVTIAGTIGGGNTAYWQGNPTPARYMIQEEQV